MFAKLLTGFSRKAILVLLATFFWGGMSYAQDTISRSVIKMDSTLMQDTLLRKALDMDSTFLLDTIQQRVRKLDRTLLQDTVSQKVFDMDSTMVQNIIDLKDTIIATVQSNLGLDANVEYESEDSIHFDMKSSEVFMYGEAGIVYDQIDLDAAFIKIEFSNNELIAEGVKDSLGNLIGNPIFKEGEKSYTQKYMKYNYQTKKAYIKDVVTEEGEGFLHGTDLLKLQDDAINISHGTFTTCSNPEHPHFGFNFSKAKVIPNKKIITGPATLVIEGVPTPLTIPFVMFPINPGQRSGIVMPTYGESAQLGFFLQGGGYYWGISDYLDLKITGDIHSRGSWAIKPEATYVKKYKYRGSIKLGYAINKTGADNENKNKDFSINWSHSQDAKARPNGQFSANVNIKSSKFNTFNPTSTEDFLTNTFQSSVSYQTNIAGKYRFTANASHSQNTKTKMVTINLPEISFSVNQFYPFRKKGKAGQFKWYDNISMNYSMNAKNTVNIADSLLFTSKAISQMRNGIKHSIPISSNLKVLRVFNLNLSVPLTNRTYFNRVEQEWITDKNEDGTSNSYNKLDTVGGFYNVFDFKFSADLQTTIYGQVDFKQTSALRAIRHVITPSIGFSYTPDFSKDSWGYYDYRYNNDEHSDSTKYSYYQNELFGTPSGSESGTINFGIVNNLEIKVRDRNDTISGTKKIKIIENLNISTSYNLMADSLKWSLIRISGRTKLFKSLDINYTSTLNPYAADSTGKPINMSEWKANKRLWRTTNSSWSFGFRFKLQSKKRTSNSSNKNAKGGGLEGKGGLEGDEQNLIPEDDKPVIRTSSFGSPGELRNINDHPEQYIDWTIPWTLNVNYKLSYNTNFDYKNNEKNKDNNIIQTLGINGDISITPKWKIEYRADYDFKNKKIAVANFTIRRDLHCWDMSFNWIPIGQQKSWSFSLKVKASVLQDLKIDKKKDFRDNLY